MPELTFWGACDTVTGSCYQLTEQDCNILVDCGLFQGSKDARARNEEPFPFDPAELDFVVLTHAHIDHSGLLPKLVKDGFQGTILAHKATLDLAQIMLPDSAHIQQSEAEWTNRKNRRSGEPLVEPLYTVEDAYRALERFQPLEYGEEFALSESIWLKLHDAGHILGSCIVELGIRIDGHVERVVFSGDLGVKGRPIIRDPVTLEVADIVVIESTYGDRLHEPILESERHLRDILRQACKDEEKVIIPAFAVGRTQEVLYEINKLYREGEVPLIPVYIDSPLAVSATEIYQKNSDLFDQETWELLNASQSPFRYPKLTLVTDVEDSMALNTAPGPMVIISASGMAEAGRIKHHLKHNLWRETAHVLFVGYQGEGTLGRRIRDGAPTVTIFGEEIAVRAQIHALDGFSAHADQNGLLEWLQAFAGKPRAVFVTHGEQESRRVFAELVRDRLNLNAVIPMCSESFDLSAQDLVAQIQEEVPEEDWQLAEIDTLWRSARSLLVESLSRGGKRRVKDARRLAQRLAEAMREVRNKLG